MTDIIPKNNSAYQNRLRFNRAKRLNKGAPAWNPHDLVQATKGLANVHRAGQTLAKVLQILQQASLRKIPLTKSLLNTIFQELKSHYIEDKKIKTITIFCNGNTVDTTKILLTGSSFNSSSF